MFFYIVFILTLVLILFGRRSHDKYSIAIFIIWFVSAFRFDVGYDYSSYYTLMYPVIDEQQISRFELFPRLLALYCGKWSVPSLFFICSSTFITILFYKTLYKFSSNLTVSILLYVTLCFLPSLGVIRQALAVAVVFYAFKYIYDKIFYKYLLAILIATLFHSSAVICIFFYPLYHFATTPIVLVLCFIVLRLKNILFQYLSVNELSFSNYVDILDDFEGGSVMRYFYILLFIFVAILSNLKKTKDTWEMRLLPMLVPSMFMVPLLGGHMGVRMTMFFLPFYLLLIPKILSRYNRHITAWALVMFISYFILVVKIDGNNPIKSAYTPYRSLILNNNVNTFK